MSKINMARNVKDYTGQKFGSLLVIKRIGEKYKSTKYKCLCDCGNEITILTENLIRHNKQFIKSCGCQQKKTKIPWVSSIYNDYKRGALDRKLEFDLSIKDFEFLVFQDCFYCGSSLSNSWKKPDMKKELKYNGIDRVDNNKGYNIENCVPCCRICNSMKSKMKKDDFLNHIIKIYDRIKEKK
jgi:hypothetical protein